MSDSEFSQSNDALQIPNVAPELLSTLNLPDDLKNLSLGDMRRLALEIRSTIYRMSEKRCVHFASNLGVVELAIALHRVFDFKYDRLVWDVGHQCYPHKLLTGRFEQFETLRTRGGLAGYPNPAESEYDLFLTGHAGCSIGTALGLACGDRAMAQIAAKSGQPQANRRERYAVAVVGDGAFSSGPIFEALNHAGGLRQKMLVVLNDNKMSICKRVGGLGRYLDHIRMAPGYLGVKMRLRRVLEKIPTAYACLYRFREMLRAGLVSGALFEDFGFQYIGPIDGHDLPMLCKFLEAFKSSDGPVLLHVLTEKGRGFHPAELDPSKYHSSSPAKICGGNKSSVDNANFDPSAVRQEPKETLRRMASVVGVPRMAPDPNDESSNVHEISSATGEASFTYWAKDAIYNALRDNPRVCVIVAAMTQGNMLEKARADFPDRFFDVGICEAHAVNFAAGLAKAGMRPIVCVYSGFLQRAYDHLFQEISLQNLAVVFMLDRAGLVGEDGATHHGVFDLSYLRPFPNMNVIAPGDASDLQGALEFALRSPRPTAIRYPKANTGLIDRKYMPFELGKGEVIREGTDGSFVVCGGGLLKAALELAQTLSDDSRAPEERFDVGVVNARFVKPLDVDAVLKPVREGKPIVTVEENMLSGGFGSAVLEAANAEGLDTRLIVRVGAPDRFIEHGSRREELADAGLDSDSLERAFKEAVKRARLLRK